MKKIFGLIIMIFITSSAFAQTTIIDFDYAKTFEATEGMFIDWNEDGEIDLDEMILPSDDTKIRAIIDYKDFRTAGNRINVEVAIGIPNTTNVTKLYGKLEDVIFYKSVDSNGDLYWIKNKLDEFIMVVKKKGKEITVGFYQPTFLDKIK